jgi:aspartate racemase
MKTAGIIGGIGPESTIDYYRAIVAEYQRRIGDGSYPALIINCIDLKKMLDLIGGGRFPEVTGYLAAGIQSLAEAGADFGLLAANTPHVVFDALRSRSPIPLISIVEVTCREARNRGLGRVGLLGTRFTMQGRFYPEVFGKAGMSVIAPAAGEQTFIHDAYMSELVKGIFTPETRGRLVAIVERLAAEEGIDGVILGGTELPLVLRGTDMGKTQVLDTTRLHVAAIVAQMIAA